MNKTERRKIILDFLIDWRDNFDNYKGPLCFSLHQYEEEKNLYPNVSTYDQLTRHSAVDLELFELFDLAGLNLNYPFNYSKQDFNAELISQEGHLIYSNPKRVDWVNRTIAMLEFGLSVNRYEGME